MRRAHTWGHIPYPPRRPASTQHHRRHRGDIFFSTIRSFRSFGRIDPLLGPSDFGLSHGPCGCSRLLRNLSDALPLKLKLGRLVARLRTVSQNRPIGYWRVIRYPLAAMPDIALTISLLETTCALAPRLYGWMSLISQFAAVPPTHVRACPSDAFLYRSVTHYMPRLSLSTVWTSTSRKTLSRRSAEQHKLLAWRDLTSKPLAPWQRTTASRKPTPPPPSQLPSFGHMLRPIPHSTKKTLGPRLHSSLHG